MHFRQSVIVLICFLQAACSTHQDKTFNLKPIASAELEDQKTLEVLLLALRPIIGAFDLLVRAAASDVDSSTRFLASKSLPRVLFDGATDRRGCGPGMLLELSDSNVRQCLADFVTAAESMFGDNPRAASVGITGSVTLVDIDGPIVLLALQGRFWHRRETVLRNARAYLMNAIPELADVDLADPDDLLDEIVDEEFGIVIEDRRAPDWNGDRQTLEYQGIDPDMRGPFPNFAGNFGSMFS